MSLGGPDVKPRLNVRLGDIEPNLSDSGRPRPSLRVRLGGLKPSLRLGGREPSLRVVL